MKPAYVSEAEDAERRHREMLAATVFAGMLAGGRFNLYDQGMLALALDTIHKALTPEPAE